MKSLEARKADRAKRREQAEADQKDAREILSAGTLAEGKTANDEGNTDASDEGYDAQTVAELKEELDARGIEYSSNAKKAELVKALEDDDAAA